ncbi:MAG TPA: alpha/beta hydrolase [Burkholderiaceae bacterium]|nr:alpha/beta hydrolase [Burkholderiaceae bacterium]
MSAPTVLIVPGLRDHVARHWQTLLEARLRTAGRPVAGVPPLGRDDLACDTRVAAIEQAAQAIGGPIVLVAHSGGCVMLAHWAVRTQRPVQAALLAAPPDFDRPLPEAYPTLAALRTGGWLPVPRTRLPFPSIVAASRNDPLADYDRVAALARDWGSRLVDLGEVGHLNPASGFGEWPQALAFVDALTSAAARQAALN